MRFSWARATLILVPVRRIAVVIATVCVAVSLTGCMAEPAAPPGISSGDRDAYRDQVIADQWSWVELTTPQDEPALPDTHYVKSAEWPDLMNSCIADAGIKDSENYAVYTAEGSRSGWSPDARGDRTQIANFVCQARYMVDPAEYGVMSKEEASAMYDYYVTWLTPCLQMRGYAVTDTPSRPAFMKSTSWSPYLQLIALEGKGQLPNADEIAAACPPYPKWSKLSLRDFGGN